jgi:radical SAM superfamily enzyme YgiQ (UPF0313 family)
MLDDIQSRANQGHACCGTSAPIAKLRFNLVLINPYELGRQPFALAEASAWLKRAGCEVRCLDLALQKLEPAVLAEADAIAVYLGMHTATRIALEALPRLRQLAPQAALAAFGLYAPMNETLLRGLGVTAIFGGESEPDLVAWAHALRAGKGAALAQAAIVRHDKIEFLTPDRSGLPPLMRYAHLVLPDGATRVAGFVDSTRGCKHLCRHCPVAPVYEGKFRVVPLEVVMADIAQQIESGAQHISFGDHDFLNGPTHALNVVRALHERYPQLTYDATIKIQHLIDHAELLPELKRTGCLFIIAAVESVDDRVLDYLAKRHTRADFYRAAGLVREAGIALAPTWVAFHPWSTLDSYLDLLTSLVELRLVEAVPPVQLMIRLLIPGGSKLLELPGFQDLIGAFDPKLLGYPWQNPDPRVDALQREIQSHVAQAEKSNTPRRETFEHIWRLTHEAAGKAAPSLANTDLGQPIPHLSEPWYCCAEPTEAQLEGF